MRILFAAVAALTLISFSARADEKKLQSPPKVPGQPDPTRGQVGPGVTRVPAHLRKEAPKAGAASEKTADGAKKATPAAQKGADKPTKKTKAAAEKPTAKVK